MGGGTSARTADAGRANEESISRLGTSIQNRIVPSERKAFKKIGRRDAIKKLRKIRSLGFFLLAHFSSKG
jgi:hypothetical protein